MIDQNNESQGVITLDQLVTVYKELKHVSACPTADYFMRQEASIGIFALRMCAAGAGFALEMYSA
jgi:hypothetical protein